MRQKKGFDQYVELPDRVKEAIVNLGFFVPTKVQERVIADFFHQSNLIVEAPTGTGKTAAYGLPLIARLNLQKRSTQALVLLPTRELATQVAAALQSYYNGKGFKVGLVIGGDTMEESLKQIKSNPHILVTVPGRLQDIMTQHKYEYLWRDIKFLILDEGDKLLESGFASVFEWIRKQIRANIQMGFFSATISPDAEKMMKELIPKAKIVRLKPKEVLRNINFQYVEVETGKREIYLHSLLQTARIRKALIFCSKRDDIISVTNFMRNAGYMVDSYYGTQEQNERQNILQRFREGHIHFLVGSDLAARGLDILDLPAVINLAIPTESDYYVHRVGRTGRAGAKGKVYNLISNEIEKIIMLRHHKEIEIDISPMTLELISPKTSTNQKRIKCHFSRGKADKVRKADIVGFLTNTAHLNADEIGTVTIYDTYTVVDLPQDGLDSLLHDAEHLTLKGKSVKVRKFSTDEQTQKDMSVKNLLKDRRAAAKTPDFVEKIENPEKYAIRQKEKEKIEMYKKQAEKVETKGKGRENDKGKDKKAPPRAKVSKSKPSREKMPPKTMGNKPVKSKRPPLKRK
ncbi:MAG: DEAD/DEAH box helicase [Bacteroidia bacterium]